MRFYILIFVIFFNFSYSQNLTGVWKGTICNSSGKTSVNDFEMQILQTKNSFTALINYSFSLDDCNCDSDIEQKALKKAVAVPIAIDNYFDKDCSCGNTSNKETNENITFSFEGIRIFEKQVTCTIGGKNRTCNWLSYNLKWHKEGGKECLLGKAFRGIELTRGENIKLEKRSALSQTQRFLIEKSALKKLPSIASSPFFLNFEKSGISTLCPIPIIGNKTIPIDIATRENEKIKAIKTNSKQVKISIYDYGQIDHDVISVYVDKKPVLVKEELTKKPLIVNLEMDNYNNSHEVILVAENLGDIPPNTALMKIKAGDKNYEIKITSTEQKNAVIEFKYKE